MDAPDYKSQTSGEKRVESLLIQLSGKGKHYFVAEPSIPSRDGTLHPDFIVGCWEQGVAVIEVKDWLQFLADSDAEQVSIKQANGTKKTFTNPGKTAWNYATAVADILQRDPTLLATFRGQEKLCFPWQEVVIFPNIHQEKLNQLMQLRVLPDGIALGRESLRNLDTFEAALKSLPWRFTMNKPLKQIQQDSIRVILKPTLRVGETGVLSPLQELLSEEAISVAEDNNLRLVRGIAGSGKSLVLERRVRFVREKQPELKLLVMAFNEQLEKNLRLRIDDDTVEVHTFHSVCARIIRTANRDWRGPSSLRGWLQHYWGGYIEEQGMSVDFVSEEIGWRKDIDLIDNMKYLVSKRAGRGVPLIEEKRQIINEIFDDYRKYQDGLRLKNQLWEDWHDVPALAMRALKENPNHDLLGFYDVILLDEAQDFAPTWIAVVRKLLREGGTLFICDDPTQSLFRQFSWKQKGIEVRGRTRILRVPFRSTREINLAAHALVEADALLGTSPDIVKPLLDSPDIQTGKMPLLASCSKKDVEERFVQREIEELCASGISGDQIAILCHNGKDIDRWAWMKNKYGITVMSFDKMKGLEYRAVFLPGLETAFVIKDKLNREHNISKNRQRVFTGMTRARQLLALSHLGDLPPELEAILPYVFRDYIT
jgi:hypothetical protein